MSAGYKMQAEAWRKVYSELGRIYGEPFSIMGPTGLDCAINAIKDLEKRASAIDKILRALKDTRMSLNAFMEISAALSAEPAAQGEVIYQYRHKGAGRGFDDVTKEEFDNLAKLPTSEMRIVYTTPPAQPAERVPDGWVLVPREPTPEMIEAAEMRDDDEPMTDWGKIVSAPHAEIYKAMLAATPAAPAEENQL